MLLFAIINVWHELGNLHYNISCIKNIKNIKFPSNGGIGT